MMVTTTVTTYGSMATTSNEIGNYPSASNEISKDVDISRALLETILESVLARVDQAASKSPAESMKFETLVQEVNDIARDLRVGDFTAGYLPYADGYSPGLLTSPRECRDKITAFEM